MIQLFAKRIQFHSTERIFPKNKNHQSLFKRNHAQWNLPKGKETGIKVTNSLSLKEGKVDLNLPSNSKLSWYTCGPTVYEEAHIGHARSYVSVDILQRILNDHFGIHVIHLMGMTDVDNKIIQKAKDTNQSFSQVAQYYEDKFLKDMDLLGVKRPTCITRVSEHIPEIISFVEKIIQNGKAYVVPSGSVYFAMDGYEGYGKLLSSAEKLQPIEETEHSSEKRNPKDFSLWKAAKEGEPYWDSPWGKGRPGWHIECSTMICSIFPQSLDVHSGGIDLKFPHHENEIAQCTAYLDLEPHQNWANYFLHTGHLHIAGRKMSKSLKNFVTIRQLITEHSGSSTDKPDSLETISSNVFRVYCLNQHYRSNIEFNNSNLLDSVIMEGKLYELCHLQVDSSNNSSKKMDFIRS